MTDWEVLCRACKTPPVCTDVCLVPCQSLHEYALMSRVDSGRSKLHVHACGDLRAAISTSWRDVASSSATCCPACPYPHAVCCLFKLPTRLISSRALPALLYCQTKQKVRHSQHSQPSGSVLLVHSPLLCLHCHGVSIYCSIRFLGILARSHKSVSLTSLPAAAIQLPQTSPIHITLGTNPSLHTTAHHIDHGATYQHHRHQGSQGDCPRG